MDVKIKKHEIYSNDKLIITPALNICIYFGVPEAEHVQGLLRIWEKILPIYENKLRWYRTESMPYKEAVDQDVLEMIPLWFKSDQKRRRRYLFCSYGGDAPENVDPWGIELWIFNMRKIEDAYKPLVSMLFSVPEDDIEKHANCLRLSFPVDTNEFSLDDFLSLSLYVFETMPFIHGYAGYSLIFDDSSVAFSNETWLTILKLAMRHPGYDIFVYDASEPFVYDKIKSVNWLTFLGDGFGEQFMQMERSSYLRSEEIELISAGKKLLIKAGAAPRIGDVNRKDNLPLYKQVAEAVEPFLCENHWEFSRIFDEEKTLRWIRRFNPDE